MSTVSAGRFAGIGVLFFVSGAAALIYQVLWVRQLALVFGVTVHAASSVLAAFMTGIRSRLPGERVLWKQEDGHATVTVNRRDSLFLPRPVHRMYINGAHQASDEDNMVRYHRLIGTLPLALHPAPDRALVIGVGGGATAGAVAAFSRDVSVDVVELSTAVINGARWFETVNQGLLARPNVRMHVDDGRNHMLLTRDHYDIVTADIIRPRHAGAGNLYSVEYYRLMRRVLAPRGLAVQWIGSEAETECKLIMRTFLTAFPHATLWAEGLIVGSDGPLLIERDGFERARQQPDSRRAFDMIGLTSFDALVGRYVAGPDELRAYVGPGQVLSDDRPLTEYFLALPANDRPADLSGVRGDVQRHLR